MKLELVTVLLFHCFRCSENIKKNKSSSSIYDLYCRSIKQNILMRSVEKSQYTYDMLTFQKFEWLFYKNFFNNA